MASKTEQNISTADCAARIALGVVFIALAIAATPWVNFMQLAGDAWYVQSILAVLVGALFIRAGIQQRCPINKALGLNTKKRH